MSVVETKDEPISYRLSRFAAGLSYDAIPHRVRERAKHLMLDAVGVAIAASGRDFADSAVAAAGDLSASGDSVVIARPERLDPRDAMLANGVLVHGLDYDDTHIAGVVHVSASTFPCALAVAARAGRSGRDLLTAYVLGVETSARLGMVARGGFHQVGFHPTGLVGAFGCALTAGKLNGLSADELVMAQGIALSLASGSFEFLTEGAWTKRIHPGWAAVAGATAAALARRGFVGPSGAYDGRFGLFRSYLGALEADCDYDLATAGLGERWEIDRVAVKPFPACHFNHASADAAIAIARDEAPEPEAIAAITVLVPGEVVKTVCEPLANKRRPANSYEAQFSIPYIVACGLARGRFGLGELEPDAYTDAGLLALAAKVGYAIDPDSPFPAYYSGEVVVRLKDGRELRRREEKNRGAGDRPLSAEDITAKFMDNAMSVLPRGRAEQIRDSVLDLEGFAQAGAFAEVLAAGSRPDAGRVAAAS
jgi:2-methylcitrate dehydratase PrpD